MVERAKLGDVSRVRSRCRTCSELAAHKGMNKVRVTHINSPNGRDSETTMRLLPDPTILGEQKHRLANWCDAQVELLGEPVQLEMTTGPHLTRDYQLPNERGGTVTEL